MFDVRVASIAFAWSFLLAMSCSRSPQQKTIYHNGGVLEFHLPTHWVSEYDSEGRGVFWDPTVDAGTLRLDLLTFERNAAVPQQQTITLLENLSGQGTVSSLPNGNALRESRTHTTEDGEEILQLYWEVANLVPPNHFRLAIFSYTVLSTQQTDTVVVEEIEMLDDNIRAISFSESLGVTE